MPDRETLFITGFPGFIANRLLERLARKRETNPTLPRDGTDPILGRSQYRNAVASGLCGVHTPRRNLANVNPTLPRNGTDPIQQKLV